MIFAMSFVLMIPTCFTADWQTSSFTAIKYKILISIMIFLNAAFNSMNLFLVIKIFCLTDYPVLPNDNRNDVLDEIPNIDDLMQV